MVLVCQMIECTPELLSTGQDTALRVWLDKGEASILHKVVLAQVQQAQCDALNEALQAREWGALDAKSSESMRKAHRYQTFLDVLDEIKNQKEPFYDVKLT